MKKTEAWALAEELVGDRWRLVRSVRLNPGDIVVEMYGVSEDGHHKVFPVKEEHLPYAPEEAEL